MNEYLFFRYFLEPLGTRPVAWKGSLEGAVGISPGGVHGCYLGIRYPMQYYALIGLAYRIN
jgi:hypothetical protein